ncbi:hypothetical protein BN938_0696 [Mucinivorans hirudinis]|uniref:PcfJ-like protein n=1 Tax=Mucinivorans hirudinis TaxID=1433126 RepID=A0A060R6R2_9BACT|nr:hypothetical protein BN938_0696 [Mucinivorans hirudinis]
MKPKNKFQQHVIDVSRKLPEITEPQKRWAYKHCFDHIAKQNANGVITCLECGHTWQSDNSHLADTILECECPNCATKLQINTTRQRVFKQIEYLCIVTTFGGFQVLRFFYIDVYRKSGESAYYFCKEVVQRWIATNGKFATMARLRPMSCFQDTWIFNSDLEVRPEKPLYDIMPTRVYPRQKVLPEIKRNGFKGDYHRLTPFEMLHTILTDNRAETLLKTGQTALLRCFIRRASKDINTYRNSINICTRNGYIVPDGSMWCDYIDLLRFFDRDLNSPKYICPTDLAAEHDRYVAKKQAHLERQRQEEQRQKARENEERFRELKSKFFGIAFSDGAIEVRVLESVDEFFDEGKEMHHCVFTNAYYLRPDSLIFSATIDGKRIETIEVSLKTLKVVQSRGVCNSNTEYHDQIIKLVNRNKQLIRQRMAA